jgi:lipopolysaccharide/colanic/teichoic acid biosynthesis glycosyltransferase
MNERVLNILESYEKDRKRGETIGAVIALIVIAPIMLIIILAIIAVASV